LSAVSQLLALSLEAQTVAPQVRVLVAVAVLVLQIVRQLEVVLVG
jgi:hypothetical protein